MTNFPRTRAWRKIFALGFILCLSGALFCQPTEGNFRATSIEKVNGFYYVFGINDQNEIRAIKYTESLDSVKDIKRPVNDKVGSFFGMPFIATFNQRNAFDLRIVYKSDVVAWLTFDMDLNETGYKEYLYSKKNTAATEPSIFNPVYSEPSYGSNFVSPTPLNGCFVGNYYYQFLNSGSPEFSNTVSDKYIYYDGSPVIRKMELIQYAGPFYREVKRVPLSQSGIGNFSPADYRISFMFRDSSQLYFLAKKTDGDQDARIIGIDENTLTVKNKIELNLNPVGAQLGEVLHVTTVYDPLKRRIIQVGNCTGNAPEHDHGFMQQESFFVSEYDLLGKITHFRKIPYPDYNLYTQLNSRKFDLDYKSFIVEENGIRFSGDGSIRLVGKNEVLTSFKYSEGKSSNGGAAITRKGYYYSTILVSFLSIDPNFETVESKAVLKKLTHKNHKYDLYDVLKDFSPGPGVNNATALFVSRTVNSSAFGLSQQGQNTSEHSLFSAYYGMRSLKAGIFKSVFILNGEKSFIFDKSKGGKFGIGYVANRK